MAIIYDELKSDHDKVRALLEEMSELSDRASKTRQRDFENLKEMMTAHSRAEERVFYGALKGHDKTKDDALEGFEEHHVVDLLLREIARLGPADDRWKAKFTVLKENIEHHAEEEEREFFAKAREVLSDEEAEELGRKFVALRDKLLKAEA
jgi:hemerythrin superfamily protein